MRRNTPLLTDIVKDKCELDIAIKQKDSISIEILTDHQSIGKEQNHHREK